MITESKTIPGFGVSQYLNTGVIITVLVTPHRVAGRSRTQIIYLYNILIYKRYIILHVIPIHCYQINLIKLIPDLP